MNTKDLRLPWAPYLFALLLIGVSVLLDGAQVRSRVTFNMTFNIWPRIILVFVSMVAFALLAALFIWLLARLGLSTAGAWIFIVCGLLLTAAEMIYFFGWAGPNFPGIFFGDFFRMGSAFLLAGGVLALIARVGKQDLQASEP